MPTRTLEPIRPEIRSLEPYVPGKPVEEPVMSHPAFVMFAVAVRVAGGPLVRVRGRELFHDPPAMLAAINDRTRLVYFSNPDNPTGTMVTRRELDAYFDRVPDHVLTI